MPLACRIVLKVYGHAYSPYRDIRNVETGICYDCNTKQRSGCDKNKDGAEVGPKEDWRECKANRGEDEILNSLSLEYDGCVGID